MKQKLFTLLMMLALVVIASGAWAQTSTTPRVGGSYSYSISGMDAAPAGGRYFEIYLTDNTGTAVAGGVTYVSGTSGTLPGTDLATAQVIPESATQVNFIATFSSSLTVGDTYRLYFKVYNDAAHSECSNWMFMNVVPAANNINATVTVASTSVCPATTEPTVEKTDALDATMDLTFTITRTNGNTTSDWSYVVGATTYNVAGGSDTDTRTVTHTITPGASGSETLTVSNITEYIGTTTTVSISKDITASETITVREAPSFGATPSFVGN